MACVLYKCADPCIGLCGTYAICNVEQHIPTCSCPPGYMGDPFFQCREAPVTGKNYQSEKKQKYLVCLLFNVNIIFSTTS